MASKQRSDLINAYIGKRTKATEPKGQTMSKQQSMPTRHERARQAGAPCLPASDIGKRTKATEPKGQTMPQRDANMTQCDWIEQDVRRLSQLVGLMQRLPDARGPKRDKIEALIEMLDDVTSNLADVVTS